MKHFDKLKDNLRADSHLPEEFSWDNMQEGIYRRMPQKDDGQRIVLMPFLALATLLLILSFVGYFGMKSLSENPTHDSPLSKGNDIASQVSEINLTETFGELTSQSSKEDVNERITEPKREKDIDKANSALAYDLNTKVTEQSRHKLTANQSPENLTTYNNPSSTLENTLWKSSNIITLDSRDNGINTPLATNGKNYNRKIGSLSYLSTKASYLSYQKMTMDLSDRLAFSVIDIKNDMVESHQWSASLGFGLNYLMPDFGDSAWGKERKENEIGDYGYDFELGIKKEVSDHWFISSGLRWSVAYTKLDKEFLRDYTEQRMDQLVEVINNPFATQPIEVRKDTVVNVSEIRAIVHYNKIRQVSIPLLLGYKKEAFGLVWGIGVGPELSYVKFSDGRTIQDEVLLEFEGDSFYKNGFQLGLVIKANIAYPISDDWYIGSSFSMTRNLTDSGINGSTLKLNILSAGLNVGLKF